MQEQYSNSNVVVGANDSISQVAARKQILKQSSLRNKLADGPKD